VIIDLENLELAHGHRRLAVPRARVDISFPAECVRFDLRRQDARAWVTATVDVPKDESPLRRGGLWQLRVARHGRLFALSLLAVELVDSTEGSCRWRRLHTWTMAIVGFTCDPLDWFPKPSFLREGPDADILADLAAFLREEVGPVEAVRYTSEGGFRYGRDGPAV
jgi:hypothetical protein